MDSYRWFSELTQTLGLAYFIIIFLAVLVATLWPGSQEKMNAAARLPLNED